MKARKTKVPMVWIKLSKGHYEANDVKTASVFNLDVAEPDEERYFWLVTRTSEAGIDIQVGGADHVPEAKALVAKAIAGKAIKSARNLPADARPEVLACALTRDKGTIRPPKVGKSAPAPVKTIAPKTRKRTKKTAESVPAAA